MLNPYIVPRGEASFLHNRAHDLAAVSDQRLVSGFTYDGWSGDSFFALLVAVPVFRVRGDYLAIVTLGFGEVIQVVTNNIVPITNGPLGPKGLAPYTNLWWSWGVCLMTLFCIVRLVNSSYGPR